MSMLRCILRIFTFIIIFSLLSCAGSASSTSSSINANVAVSNNPDNGSVDRSRQTNFSLTFNTTVEALSLNTLGSVFLSEVVPNDNQLKVAALKSKTIPLELQALSPDGKTAIFKLPQVGTLSGNTKYNININLSIIKSSSGNPLGNGIIVVSTFTTSDYTAPMVNLVMPSDGTNDLTTSPSIQVAFSESVQNVNQANVTLHKGSPTGDKIALTSFVASSGNIYTFSPASNLSGQTTYYLTFGKGITDLSGNSLSETTFKFTTGDIDSPTVNLVIPANGANNISTLPVLQVAFSEAVQNVNQANVTLHKGSPTGPEITLGNIVAGVGNTYTFIALSALSGQTTYYIVLSSGIIDKAGNSLAETTFSFITGDFTVPTVSMITPSNGATKTSTRPSIQILFSEAVQNINFSNVTLHKGYPTGPNIALSNVLAGSDNKYTLSLAEDLSELTTYYVELGSGITDTSGNALSAITFSFTTGKFSVPEVSLINPTNGSSNISISPSIQIAFSEAVQNVNSNNVTLHVGSPTGQIINLSSIILGLNNTYTLSASSALSEQTTYYLVLGPGITDTHGNALLETSFSFTTGDFTAPTVSLINPSDGAINVDTSPNIRAAFSEAVQNVNSNNITLHKNSPTGTIVPLGMITEGPENTYVFKPSLALSRQSVYYIVFGSGITDAAGNPLVQRSFSFTTKNVWSPVGNIGFSKGESSYTKIAIDSHGTAYVAYIDLANNRKITVMKFNGTSWVVVGVPGFSEGAVINISLAIDTNGVPYVAYQDESNNYKSTVMKFNGNSWEVVGTPNFADASPYLYAESLAIDHSNTPYLAYSDINQDFKATVMKFNGANWVVVGAPGFSAERVSYTNLAINPVNGVPYIVYQNAISDRRATVMKFDGTSWEVVGSPGFTTGPAYSESLAIDANGTPYVAYKDESNNYKVTVMKFNGTNWEVVGSPGFSEGVASFISLALDASGKLYVGYSDAANGNKATVMSFNGTNWEVVGFAGFSAGDVLNTSLAINPIDGTPYIAYVDEAIGGKITVMNYLSD